MYFVAGKVFQIAEKISTRNTLKNELRKVDYRVQKARLMDKIFEKMQ